MEVFFNDLFWLVSILCAIMTIKRILYYRLFNISKIQIGQYSLVIIHETTNFLPLTELGCIPSKN
jgi:hypothetical protein